jgi:hypothetical protein
VRWNGVLAPVTPPPMITTSAVRAFVMEAMLTTAAPGRNAPRDQAMAPDRRSAASSSGV